jgi:UDP-N-acetylmuramoyl-L-alanyl-D-glutamate--2,6-diaminopimelate ligase
MVQITLKSLFNEFPLHILSGKPDSTIITNVISDSREIQHGDLFVATQGGKYNAHNFIPQAIKNGCKAVVGMEGFSALEVPYIQVENSRQALAYLSAAFYDFPARKMTVIGVTGTDGKTTTCKLIFEILQAAEINAGMITTVNAVLGEEVVDTGFHVTTPDSPTIQRYLSEMWKRGMTHVILETTSHGWAQFRVDACEFDVGVVTNVTHEHIDEHGSYDDYRVAKGRLFESLLLTQEKGTGNPRLGILNADDASYDYLKSKIPDNSKSYSLNSNTDLFAENIHYNLGGMNFQAVTHKWRLPITSKLTGIFNVSNCLAALAATIFGLGIQPEIASKGINNLSGIPGRMEQIDLGQDFTALVDFAHTPNALLNTIEATRTFISGRVIVIVGSAGLRDREKRRLMAEISIKNADLTIFTAEDPRTESLDDILAEMAAGAQALGGEEGVTFWRIPDRGEAIRFGLTLAKRGDVVVACGKGHEQSMCFDNSEYPWDDRIALRAGLSEILGISGPRMPDLPTQKYH